MGDASNCCLGDSVRCMHVAFTRHHLSSLVQACFSNLRSAPVIYVSFLLSVSLSLIYSGCFFIEKKPFMCHFGVVRAFERLGLVISSMLFFLGVILCFSWLNMNLLNKLQRIVNVKVDEDPVSRNT